MSARRRNRLRDWESRMLRTNFVRTVLRQGLSAVMVCALCLEAIAQETGQAPLWYEQVYEFTETSSLRREGGQQLQVSSSQGVVVRSRGDVVRIELHPELATAELARGEVVLDSSQGSQSRRALPKVVVEFRFRPGNLGAISVDGLRGNALVELAAMLNQPRATLPIRAQEQADYDVQLLAGDKPCILRAHQKNGELWVDWTLSGDGEIRVGSGEIQLPIDFALDGQELPARMKLSSAASMRYSSARPGPELETTVKTKLEFTLARGTLSYERSCTLKPLAVKPQDVPAIGESAGAAFLSGEGFLGEASRWARSCTLATLGIQQMAGIRDVGLAIWLAQASADFAAGRQFERDPAAAEARKLSPTFAPPPGLVPESLTGGPLLRAACSVGTRSLDAGHAGTIPFGESVGTAVDASVSVRWRKSERWLWGVGISGMTVQSIETSERFWYMTSLLAKAEYSGKKVNCAIGIGPAVIWYEFENGLNLTGGDIGGLGAELNLEWRLTNRFGLFVDYMYAGDLGTAEATEALAGFRWFARPNLAFQLAVGSASLVDNEGKLGRVEQTVPFAVPGALAAGLQVRW